MRFYGLRRNFAEIVELADIGAFTAEKVRIG